MKQTVYFSPVLEEKTRSKVKFETLIRHLAKRDERILLQVLILMNTIYERSTVSEKENIQLIIRSKPFIDSISSAIEAESKCRDDKIRLQFLLIQEIIFDSLKVILLCYCLCKARKPPLFSVRHCWHHSRKM